MFVRWEDRMIQAETRAFLNNTPPNSNLLKTMKMTEKEDTFLSMNNNNHSNPVTNDQSTSQSSGKEHRNDKKSKSKGEEEPVATEEDVSDESPKEKEQPSEDKKRSTSSSSSKSKKSSSSKGRKNQWKEEASQNPWAGQHSDRSSRSSVSWTSSPDDDHDSDEEMDVVSAMKKGSKSSSLSKNNEMNNSLSSISLTDNNSSKGVRWAPTTRAASQGNNLLTPLVETHVAVRVMKGEIHNVLTAMRSSEQSYMSAQRFAEELYQDQHPLVVQFQELHASMSDWDLQMAAQSLYKRNSNATSNNADSTSSGFQIETPDSMLYLPPFCTAVSTREINASVTGACLTALHKFLLYGLVHPARDAKQGMTLIARSLLHCSFEEARQEQPSRRRGLRRNASTNKSLSSGISASSRNIFGSANSVVSFDLSEGQSTSVKSKQTVKSKSDASANNTVASSTATLNHPYYHPTRVTDEQVVLKLLDLAALVVRCSFLGQGGACLITSDLVAGLLDTCLHVSHIAKSASPLLKSAAQDALAQIVLQVFCKQQQQQLRMEIQVSASSRMIGQSNAAKAREQVLAKLASLLNPANHKQLDPDRADNDKDDRKAQENVSSASAITHPSAATAQVICSSLDAVNIALEHLVSEELSPQEILILQNDLCKYLLQWSTTADLQILSLTLRVIFNLFQSIQNQLKVPLEVFLTSVHLRILNHQQQLPQRAIGQVSQQQQILHMQQTAVLVISNYEEREVVLESILEFCQEPALMQDIYRNYDCDIACTNLFEQIVQSLAKAAMPNNMKSLAFAPAAPIPKDENTTDETASTDEDKPTTEPSSTTAGTSKSPAAPSLSLFSGTQTMAVAPVTQLNKLALEGLLAILNSIARRVYADRSPFLQNLSGSSANGMSLSPGEGDLMDSVNMGGSQSDLMAGMSEDELQQRRQLKNSLAQVAEVFNEDPFGQEWLDMAVNLDALESADNPKGVAELLYSASGLNKAQVGVYLSKGPDDKYPFHAQVRHEFVALYDFSELGFAGALRLFLSKFRLPGEAQCIDRFMESFSHEFFRQQSKDRKKSSLFQDADAVYVLSFSTIMLNTDLHNPGIKEASRMTKEQFIKNNRGINGGDDLPSEYLSDLYDEIKTNQIQVQREVGEFIKKQEDDEDFKSAWDSILAKHREVATAFFTSAGDARRNIFRAGRHDREMFTVLCEKSLQALFAVYVHSWDDGNVFKTLRGLKQIALIADHFEMQNVMNELLEFLLEQGKEYVHMCAVQDYNPDFSVFPNRSSRSLGAETTDDENDETFVEEDDIDLTQIPYSILSSGKGGADADYTGIAYHRGLAALDTGFLLVRRYSRKVTTAWNIFLECLCFMRDARALTAGLADLDDFADSQGHVLRLSPYARGSQKRLDQYYFAKATENDPKFNRSMIPSSGLTEKGWFERLWGSRSSSNISTSPLVGDEGTQDRRHMRPERQMGEATRALMAVAESTNVEKIVQMGSTKLPVAETTVHNLLNIVDGYPYQDDPVAEQHAIFSLELAARALLSNREKAVEIFPTFLAKFENILGQISEESIPSPFVIERIVVTILRCSIHLYDMEELRPNLRVSLHLLVMSIPRLFIRDIADRMACGLAIILRASFPFFESHNEWNFIGDTLDSLANYASARVFVFDGIASTVECAVPHDEEEDGVDENKERFPLSIEGCGALSRILIRFVLGYYQSDFSLSVPASVCLEKLFRHMNGLLLDKQVAEAAAKGEKMEISDKDRKYKVPNKDYWQNVAVALYSVCRSPDPEVSRHGYEICQRVILRTPLREIPSEKWLAILYLMVNKQPPTNSDLSRSNTFVLLGNMLMRVLPYLSKRQRPPKPASENEGEEGDKEKKPDDNLVDGEDLADLIRLAAALAGENLRHGRRGTTSPLFEKTLQTVTYLSNHMQTDDWKGDKEFALFASETLLAELEKMGEAGMVGEDGEVNDGATDSEDQEKKKEEGGDDEE